MRKIDRLVDYIIAEDWRRALALAASFPRLGPDKAAIVRGWEALAHPRFYAQMGDAAEFINDGKAALLRRYAKEIKKARVNDGG